MDRGAWWGMVFNPTCVHAKLLQSCQILCNPMVACHALLSMGFSRQEYLSRLPCPPALVGEFFTTSTSWEAHLILQWRVIQNRAKQHSGGLHWWLSGTEPACQRRRRGSVPKSGRSPGVGNGNPLQYTCLWNPMDRGAWWATVHGVAKSQTQLSNWTHTSTQEDTSKSYSCPKKS